MSRTGSICFFIAAVLFLSGCTSISVETRGPQLDVRIADRGPLNIPPGHLPPPGQCRIWYLDRSPGQQPPPGTCSALVRNVPPGAWLISRPDDKGKNVKVSVYHPLKLGIVVVIRIYDAETGRFLSEERP